MSKQGEIDYPNKLSKEGVEWLYTKPFGISNLLVRHLHDFTVILSILDLPKHSKVIDLACGSGWTSIYLAKSGFKVKGVDISAKMIDIARKRAESESEGIELEFESADIEDYMDDEKYDAVTIYDALHHCDNWHKVIKNAAAMLKKGGKLLMIEPGKGHQKANNSKKAIDKYDVSENDLDVVKIKQECLNNGFIKVKTYFSTLGPLIGKTGILGLGNMIRRIILHKYFRENRIILLAINGNGQSIGKGIGDGANDSVAVATK